MFNSKEDDWYSEYELDGDGFYDDSIIMHKLIQQFVDALENTDDISKLDELINLEVENIKCQVPSMDESYIRSEILQIIEDVKGDSNDKK